MKYITFLSLILFSCESYDYRVQTELQPYVNKFYEEAQKRGITLQRDNLIMTISEDTKGALGLTKFASNGSSVTSQIYVNINATFFNTKSEQCVESVVFHELGHALLLRKHCDCYGSIMNVDTERHVCYPANTTSREDLLDELFR